MKVLLLGAALILPVSAPALLITFDAEIPDRILSNTNLLAEIAEDVSPVVTGVATNVIDGTTNVVQVFATETNEEKVTRQIAKQLQSIIRRLFSKADRDIRRRASDSEAEDLQDVTVSPR